MPLWAQLEAELRGRLEAGEFDEGFPTDAQLVSRYEVSRHTVREAIRHLNKTGVLRRERGRGTVVNRSEFEQPLGGLYSLFKSIEAAGVEQTSTVLDVGIRRDPEAASRLGLDEDADLFYLERVRYAGDAPLAVDRAWLPLALAEPLLTADFSHTALYDELERACGVRPNRGWERLMPVLPSFADRDRLGLNRNDAAFFLERLGKHNDDVIEWRTTTIRGDRYRFVADWSRDDGGGLQLHAQV
ncbi:MAG: GntR family transcriptional regulator [Verrucomicrobiales bacterium]|jgi:GntR family transcriptional regulator